jgi:hypothetical protein
MNYEEARTAIETLAGSTVPDFVFVSGLRSRQDEAMAAPLIDKNLVWFIDKIDNGVLPDGYEVSQLKIGFGTRYNKLDLSTNEAIKIGEIEQSAYAFLRSAYRVFSLIGEVKSYNKMIAYEGLMFTEYVGVIVTINIATKLPCWDY